MSRTEEVLVRLKSIVLFEHVGKELEGNYSKVYDWKQACQLRRRDSSQEFGAEARNNLSMVVDNADRERSNLWNAHGARFKEWTLPIVDEALGKLKVDAKSSKTIRDALIWDFLLILFETEYSDLVPIRTYHKIFEIYAAGHFFCGWDGEVPYNENDCPLPWGGDFPPIGRLAIY
jgi:hypothetical protein